LLVKGDSQLVIRQMKGEYKVKSDNLLDLFKRASKLMNSVDKIGFQHVYRTDNKRADFLSNLALHLFSFKTPI
jgi:ribonuclease HI